LSIDLDTARETFDSSTDFTVGIEEEFALLDPRCMGLTGRFEELAAAARDDPVLGPSVAGELISSEIEIRSGRGQDLHAALASQRECRRALFALAAAHDLALGATGTHPFSDYRRQRIIDTDHYRQLDRELRYVAWRNNTFSLHVHVGIAGAERVVAVCDRLRAVLPLLLAVSANSPYLDGRDSGLHSARTQSFTRNFPRCGVPDHFGDWQAFAAYVDFLIGTNSISEYTQVWWSVRPHVGFGTAEVRICDAQMTAGESEAVAALTVACVTQAARDHDEGVPLDAAAPRLIEENLWRAIRYGQDGRLIDLTRAEEYPAAEAASRLLDWSAPMRGELGIDPVLPEHNGAQRQRRMIESGVEVRDVYVDTVRETRETYAQEVVA
jgi:glutamate---cysteine ligase / carboxylate-amine ligase